MTHIEELKIIKRVLAGNKSEYELLVRENQNKVYNLAIKLTGSPDDALDISQEVFLKAYTGLSSYRGDSLFSSWLYRLTYNMCIDFMRKNKKTKTVPLVYESGDGEDTELYIPDKTFLPETELEKKELRDKIAKAVALLSEEHRKIFLMREFFDMSYEEIGEKLGISQGTVKSRLSRARAGIARYLIESGTFPENYRHKNKKGGKAL